MTDAVPVDWLIVEGNGRGHRAWYVRLLIDRIHEVAPSATPHVLVGADAPRSIDWLTHLGESAPPHRLIPVEGAFAPYLLRTVHRWRGPITVPDGDRWLPLLALVALVSRRRLHGGVLLLRPLRVGQRKRIADRLKAASVSVIRRCSPDLRVYKLAATARPGQVSDDVLLDPVQMRPRDTSAEAWRRAWALPDDARIALVIGDVTSRKYVDCLVRAMAHVSQETVLVIVGRPDLAVRQAVSEMADRVSVRLLEGYVSDEDLDTWVATADAVCVVHRNEGSSGILLKAAAAGTPVLVGGANSVIAAARALGVQHVVARTSSLALLGHDLAAAARLPRSCPDRRLTQTRGVAFTDGLLGR